MSYTLPQLPYDFSALEPHIDAKTMEIHYTKHHQAYLDKLNAALPEVLSADPQLDGQPVETILCNLDKVPESIRATVRNNGGGHYNHTLFWESMSAQRGGEPSDALAQAITTAFGSFAAFQEAFAAAAVGRFGSGWAWLIKKTDGSVEIVSTPNQDAPIMDDPTVVPLLGLDVWEHAYYLKYQNRRPEYITAWWNVVDWTVISQRFGA